MEYIIYAIIVLGIIGLCLSCYSLGFTNGRIKELDRHLQILEEVKHNHQR